jgi:rubrerythrin
MGKKLNQFDLSTVTDDKALAIAAYGEAVAAYRYIVLGEKAQWQDLKISFQKMVQTEYTQRDILQKLLGDLFPSACFYLTNRDKAMVCVGPRLLDARDDARFDEAMRLTIASEKRSISFYTRYLPIAQHPRVAETFSEFAAAGLIRVRELRSLFQSAGKQIKESCPIVPK